jgi:hypothetical protein
VTWWGGGAEATFLKYFSGSFSENGLTGDSSPLEVANGVAALHEAKYNSYVGKYMMASFNGASISFMDSSDALVWANRQIIASSANAYEFYPTFVGTGSDPRVLGQSFYLYYMSSVGYRSGAVPRTSDQVLMRRLITIPGAVTPPVTSTYDARLDYSTTQGGVNGAWRYVDWAAGVVTNMVRSGGTWVSTSGQANCLLTIAGAADLFVHPGPSMGSGVRWTAPRAGSAVIHVESKDYDAGGGDGVLVKTYLNGVQIGTTITVTNGQGTYLTMDSTQTVVSTDLVDVVVTSGAANDNTYDSTSLIVTVALT